VNRGKARKNAVAGTHSAGYLLISIDRVMYKAHRLAWLCVHGVWPRSNLDHKNGKRSDNRIDNLREATRAMNSQNMRLPHADNQSGLLGVVRNHTRFSARIMVCGKPLYLGTFATPRQAHAAYVQAKRKLHQGCTI
jgi:hypothetical protein